MKMMSFIQPQDVPILYEFISSSEHTHTHKKNLYILKNFGN